MKKDEIKQLLHSNVCEIVFLKKDGSERTLIGTTKQELFELDENIKIHKPISENENNVKVFDLEKQSWRSFNISSMKSFKVLGDTYEKN